MKRRRDLTDSKLGYVMCAPALIMFTMFAIYPLLKGIWISFHDWNGIGEMTWIGLKNYAMVVEDEMFWQALGHTFIYAILAPLLKNVIGLVLALLFVQKLKGMNFFRVATYIPYTFSYVVVGVLWIWVYNPNFGLVNSLLEAVGAEHLIRGWLSDSDIALFSVIMVDVWKCIGFHAVLFMAGMMSIPEDYYEAARLDGAGPVRQFISITIPQLNSTIVTSLLLAVTGAFVNNYDVINTMTGGGPSGATEVVLTKVMATSFKYSQLGKANAMSILLVIFVAFFGYLQLKGMMRDDNYE